MNFAEVPRICIHTAQDMKRMLKRLKREKVYGCDTEYFVLNKKNDKVQIVGISFYLPKANRAYYIPINHETDKPQLSMRYLRKRLNFMQSDKKKRSLWFFFKADYKCLKQHGIDVWDHKADVWAGMVLLNENIHGHLNNLKTWAWKRFKHDQCSFDGLLAIHHIRKNRDERRLFNFAEGEQLETAWPKLNSALHEEAESTVYLKKKLKAKLDNEQVEERKKEIRKRIREETGTPLAKIYKAYTNKKFKAQFSIGNVDLDLVVPYATDDAIVTAALYHAIEKPLEERGLLQHLVDYQTPFGKVLGRMELRGTPVDYRAVKREYKRTQNKVAELEAKINAIVLRKCGRYFVSKKEHEKTGKIINLNSGPQVAQLFYGDFDLPIRKYTKPNKNSKAAPKPSTDEEALTHHKSNKVVALYLEYKKEAKYLNTYLLVLLEKSVKDETAQYRIYGTFNQFGAVTGRLSSKEPNLQNQHPRVRKFYKARKGWVCVVSDYSQIELRIITARAKDRKFTIAYKNGEDVHALTASALYKFEYNLKKEHAGATKEQRQSGKTVNFSIVYGIGPDALSINLKIPVGKAREFIRALYDEHPEIEAYFDQEKEFLAKHTYVLTVLGRRRNFPEIRYSSVTSNQGAKNRIHRQAINASIQGSAGDICMLAMLAIEYYFYDSPIIEMDIQVHDEIVFFVQTFYAFGIARKIKHLMTHLPMFKHNNPIYPVPLLANVGRGPNWSVAKDAA
jgi:DNA polymerase I-like protein with 3'-5' exonuclease and polymerase domains